MEHTSIETAFYTYIDTIFTKPIHEKFSNGYKFTAAITEALTTNFNQLQGQDIREDGTVGLIYPSVTNIEESFNIVFHANFAEERLHLTHVMELLVQKREGREIIVEVIDNAIEFPNGNILWLNNKFSIPKLRDSLDHLEFIRKGENFVIPVRDMNHTTKEIDDLLNENANKEWL